MFKGRMGGGDEGEGDVEGKIVKDVMQKWSEREGMKQQCQGEREKGQ